MKKYKFESLFFFFCGLFHLHRIWAFIDSKSYNEFWLNFLEKRDAAFFISCVLFIAVTVVVIFYFIRNYKERKWWRWIYLFGGAYLFMDSVLNLFDNYFIKTIIIQMYTLEQPYYNILWGIFVILGITCIAIGKYLWNYKDNKHNRLKN
jgi:hypothetical protein